jgi:membrane associated rhomboid family serine protease
MLPLHDDQPSRRFPFATVFLIAVNSAVFYEQLRVGLDHSVDIGGLVPVRFLNSPWLPGVARMISSMFMHGSWMHLIGNMWFLFVFGKGVEAAAGAARFVLFYLLCGIAADSLYVFFSPLSDIPLIGASGAISGVLGAYLVLRPKASITTLAPYFYSIRLPAWFFLIIWFGMQILLQLASASRGHSGGDVAYLAHIGGFAAGLFLIFFFKKRGDSLGSNVSG